jgi:hypothetical protein
MSETTKAVKGIIQFVGDVAITRLDEKNKRIEQLERELAEASTELQRCQSNTVYDYGFGNGTRSVQDKLEELTELKRQLDEFKRTEPLKIAERNGLLAKVVEFERQIASGELVPVEVFRIWQKDYASKVVLDRWVSEIKQFAAEKQKEVK